MKSTAFAISVALGLAFTSLAHAYRIDEDDNGHPLHWNDESMAVRYQLAVANVPGGTAGEDAVKRAFSSWADASTNVSYGFDGYAAVGSRGYDNKNMVYWIESDWPYDRTVLAVTQRYFSRTDGHLLDADIVFNGEWYSWSVGSGGYDIENAATHEVGHFGGLGHSSVSSATMYASAVPGETSKRSLANDDRDGLDAIYGGVASSGGSSGSSSGGGSTPGGTASSGGGLGGGSGGGCAIGPERRQDPAELLGVAALLVGLVLRRRRRS